MGKWLWCVCAEVFPWKVFRWSVCDLHSQRGTFCAHVPVYVWEKRGLSDSLIKDNVRLQRCAIQALIVNGKSCSLWVLLPPTWARRWPWCQPQTSSTHAQSALDDTNSSEQRGGVHAGRDHPSTGATSPATKHLSCWNGKKKKTAATDPHIWPWWVLNIDKINTVSCEIQLLCFNCTHMWSCLQPESSKDSSCLCWCVLTMHVCGVSCYSKLMKWSFKTVSGESADSEKICLFTHNAVAGGKAQ